MHELFGTVAVPGLSPNPAQVNQMLHEAASEGSEMLFLDSSGCAETWIVESSSTGGNTKFRGKFQEANAVNKNKRMYTYDVLNQNVDRLVESMNNRGLVGELDHPSDSIIHFDKASHLVNKLWWDGNILMGEGEILPTPHGKILESLINAGVRVGISSRGVGNGVTNEKGILVIGESYRLITFDAVADPSTFAAYQKVVTSHKSETVAPQQVITNPDSEECDSESKNVTTGIHKVNSDVLVAYVGQVISNRVHNIK